MAGLSILVQPLAAQQYAFRHFGLEDGLPQSQVTALLEDQHGFLWVGTNTNGVARLSAGSFRPYTIAQGVQCRSVSGLLEDPKGHIWVSSLENGISEIAGNEVKNFGPNQGLGSTQVYNLALDPEGRILAGTRLGLYRQGADGGFTLVPLPGVWTGAPIFAMGKDQTGHVWIASRGGRIARWDGTTLEPHPLPPGLTTDDFLDLKVDPSGTPFVLLQDRILRMEKDQWTTFPLEGVGPNPKLRGLAFSGGGMQVSLGGDGLWLRDPSGASRILKQEQGLPHESITAILRDSKGYLWIGSDGDGLEAQVLPHLKSVTQGGAPGEGLGAVMGILELNKQSYLLACSTGLYQFEEGKGIVRSWSKSKGMPSSECWAPLSDGRGGAWVGTDRGLVHWHPDGRIEKGPKELDLAAVIALAKAGDHLFAGTQRGLYELDDKGAFVAKWKPPPELGSNEVFTLSFDEGELLVGLRLGVYAFKAGAWEKRFLDSPFATQSISAITRDAKGQLWVGTTNGLFQKQASGWVDRGLMEGLPDDNISFIEPLGGDLVAVGHGKGLSILGPEGPIARLTRSQGLLSDETNHNGSLLDSQGRLWIGMIGGLNILSEASKFSPQSPPAPLVTELGWPGGYVLYPTQVDLPPNPSSLNVSFALPTPIVADQPRMEALLEGVDSAWRPVEGNTIHYLNLVGGKYRFRLRASTDGIHWNEAPPVPISVHLAWHERGWARALGVLLVLLLLSGLMWWRLRRLSRQAQLLEVKIQERTLDLARQNRALDQAHAQIKRDLEDRLRMMDMVTHDLRSPITSLTLAADRLKEGLEDDAERDLLHGILQQETHRMESMVRQLLDRSRAESFFQSVDLRPCVPMELLKSIQEVLKLKAQDRGLELQVEASDPGEPVQVLADPSAMQQVLLNLFENALKFTPVGGQVGIRSSVELAPRLWRVEVWDTGRGLTEEEAERILHPFSQARPEDAAQGWGLGLSICLALLELQKGELRVRSEPGLGASFIITLPLMEE